MPSLEKSELTALETKVSNATFIKQNLMPASLTGKTRLSAPEVAHG